MKKTFLLIITILIGFLSTNVFAKSLTFEQYKNLGVQHSYVVGRYIFDLDSGVSPSLQDILIASRTFDDTEKTTLYDISCYPAFGYVNILEIYSNTARYDTSSFNLRANYIYKDHIYKNGSINYDTNIYRVLD